MRLYHMFPADMAVDDTRLITSVSDIEEAVETQTTPRPLTRPQSCWYPHPPVAHYIDNGFDCCNLI